MEPSVWLIAGPTASGKSALAIRLAEAVGGEVVNADSMQLYAGLEVLTAAPSEADRRRRPHHLYGVADPADAWSVGRWLRATTAVLDDLARRGAPAVVVGGAGLYFRALTRGLAETPAVPPDLMSAAAARFEREGEAAFRATLALRDPVSVAAVTPGDRQRLLRAWSVLEASGRPLPDWQAETRPTLKPGAWRAAVLDPPRAALYARCDARLAAMAEAGAIDEVAALIGRGLSPGLPAMKAVGVREFAAYLAGETRLDHALEAARLATRHYAKRQLTWFRNQTPAWPRIFAPNADAQWTALQPMLTAP